MEEDARDGNSGNAKRPRFNPQRTSDPKPATTKQTITRPGVFFIPYNKEKQQPPPPHHPAHLYVIASKQHPLALYTRWFLNSIFVIVYFLFLQYRSV
jgi:hypothetical protein